MTSFPTIRQVFDNPAFVAAIIFCVAAVFGQLGHAVKKWAAHEVDCIWTWIGKDPRSTVLALIGNAGGMIVFIQSGALENIYSAPNGWWHLILFGLSNGFAADSALNKAITTAKAKVDEVAPTGKP